jgi:glycosyltransferase involved in cell wall biosynthesis
VTILLGVVSYPYIRLHARYRRVLDHRWRQRRMENLLRGQRRWRTPREKKIHLQAAPQVSKVKRQPRFEKFKVKLQPRFEKFKVELQTRFEKSVDRVVELFGMACRLPGELMVHAFHYIACHWPRPRDLSVGTPAADVAAPPCARPLSGDPALLPTISIVTPSFGYGHFIEWTIRSVLMQGYPKLELIVMDGGSRDATPDVIRKYRSHLKYAESKEDKGQADAVVRGFKHSTGEIMAYLNSDDMLAPGALEFVAQYFQDHPEVDMVYSHRVIVDDDNQVTGHWILPQHSDWYMQRWDYIPQETCFWRRSIYEKVGGIDDTYRFALDFDLFVRYMHAGACIRRVDRFLGAFRVHEVSKTSSEMQAGTVHPEVLRVWRKYKVQLAHWQEMPAVGIREWIDVKSRRFAVSGKSLPGALPGVGYDFDRVWRGLLNNGTMPDEINQSANASA